MDSVTALGVTFNSCFAVSEHVTKVLSPCCGLLYALLILRTHGMPAISLYDVFRATNFFTVHQRGLDSVLQQTYPDLTRFLSGVNGSVIVRTIFQLYQNFFRTQMINFFSELLISKHMFSSQYCQPTLNTPILRSSTV